MPRASRSSKQHFRCSALLILEFGQSGAVVEFHRTFDRFSLCYLIAIPCGRAGPDANAAKRLTNELEKS